MESQTLPVAKGGSSASIFSRLVTSGNRILLTRFLALVLFLLVGISLSRWEQVSPIFEHVLSFLGWVLIGLGVVGRLWCATHIGGHKNARLVTVGPYSMSRNPLYLFSFIGTLGVMLVTETLLFPLLFAIIFWGYYSSVIAREEQILFDLHGAVYREYCAQVPRFWPRFRLLSEPSSYLVSSRHFRKAMADVIWFVVAGAFLEFLEALRLSGYLPIILRVY